MHTRCHGAVTQEPAGVDRRRGVGKAANVSPMQAVNGGRREAVAVGAGKIGRNAQCPCGSGKKYKRCHGANV